MESANERKTTVNRSPSSSISSSAGPESKGIGNPDPGLIDQTVTGPGEIASAGKGSGPNTPASTSGHLEVDVGNGVATPENNLATSPSPTGSLLSASSYDEDFQGGSTHMTEQPSGELSLATQSPPTQVMERPGDQPNTPYRIPDHVFARKPSTAPVDWSAASNDSLFSIQMGNMSFTREQFAFLGKSGELGLLGEPGTYIDFSSNQLPEKQVEISQNVGKLDEEPTSARVNEAKAVEIVGEVILESSAENDNKAAGPLIQGENHSRGSTTPPQGPSHTINPSLTDNKFHNNTSCLSRTSDGSTKSFAYLILAGSEDRSNSVKVDGMGRHKQSSPRGHGPQKQHSSQRGSQPQTPTESSTADAAESKASKPASSALFKAPKCIPCFSCCPFCN